MSPSRTCTRVTALDTLGVSVLRRWASVWPDRNELPGGGGGTMSAAALSSGLAGFSTAASGAVVGFGAVSVFVAGCVGGVEVLAGSLATSPSRLHDDRNAM